MRTFRTEEVSNQEWRWVMVFAGFFIALTLLPYAWAALVSDNTWSFLGVLANPQDGATYFAKIRQGMQGHWLYELRHTPESHDPAGFFTFYLTLGHLARLLGFSEVVIFHLARVATGLFMFAALYQLGAYIWQRVRPRRLFFALTALASGLGWLLIPFAPDLEPLPPDLNVPEAFPLYAAYANPHFPLSIGCLALLTGMYLKVFRPGFDEAPTMENGGLAIIVYSIILAIVQPQALLGIGGGILLLILANLRIRRSIPWHEIRWGSMMWLPAFPLAVYYYLVLRTNDLMAEFMEQNVLPTPNVLLTVVGYGLLLGVAVPGIRRAVRRFERDGDQFMIMWLAFNAIALYVPFSLQRRLFLGLTIPIAYFAVRALEDYWFQTIKKRWQRLAMIVAFVFMLPSQVIALGIPLVGAVADREQGADVGIVISKDYIEVFDWLNEVGSEDEVVLAAPRISLWIPARTELRVVYGHPFETVPASRNEKWVEDFFSGRDCAPLLSLTDRQGFELAYVIWGPEEREIAHEAKEEHPEREYENCIERLETDRITDSNQRKQFGHVTLFTLRPLR